MKYPAEHVTLPPIPKNLGQVKHRHLESIDLDIIFGNRGIWYKYFQFLHHTGLRAGDEAQKDYLIYIKSKL